MLSPEAPRPNICLSALRRTLQIHWFWYQSPSETAGWIESNLHCLIDIFRRRIAARESGGYGSFQSYQRHVDVENIIYSTRDDTVWSRLPWMHYPIQTLNSRCLYALSPWRPDFDRPNANISRREFSTSPPQRSSDAGHTQPSLHLLSFLHHHRVPLPVSA